MHPVSLNVDFEPQTQRLPPEWSGLRAYEERLDEVLLETAAAPLLHLQSVASVGIIVTGVLSLPLIFRLASAVPAQVWEEPRRWLYSSVIMMSPIVLALLQFITVFAAEHVRMLLVIVAFWEDLAILAVFRLLLSFLGRSSKEQFQTFERQEPTRMMWVLSPIVCFCCFSCMDARRPTATDLQAIWVFVLQFLCVNPVAAFMEASTQEPTSLFFTLRIFSLVLVVYAIVVLIESAHGALSTRRPHLKFWALKSLLIATMISHRLLQRFARSSAIETAGAVTTAVAAPFALIIYCAYPAEDLSTGDVCKEDAQEDTRQSAGDTRLPKNVTAQP